MICPTPLLLDDDLIVEVKAEACRRGAPVADTLCDLLAAELPDALREVLAAHVAEDRSSRNGHGSESQPVETASTNGDAPAIARQGTPNEVSRPPSTPTIDASGRLAASTARTEPDADGSFD
jgi:hypothetical protein